MGVTEIDCVNWIQVVELVILEPLVLGIYRGIFFCLFYNTQSYFDLGKYVEMASPFLNFKTHKVNTFWTFNWNELCSSSSNVPTSTTT